MLIHKWRFLVGDFSIETISLMSQLGVVILVNYYIKELKQKYRPQTRLKMRKFSSSKLNYQYNFTILLQQELKSAYPLLTTIHFLGRNFLLFLKSTPINNGTDSLYL